jgi:hypothetical protein
MQTLEANLQTSLNGTGNGALPQHISAYLDGDIKNEMMNQDNMSNFYNNNNNNHSIVLYSQSK